MNQGVINGKITSLANKPEALKQFMDDKTDKEKEAGRIHLKMVKFMRSRK